MWILRYVSCLAAACVLFLSSPSPAQAGRGAPRLVCPNSLWNFGKQPQYKKMTYDFVIRNEGDGTLQIREVRPSCQCQAAMPEKKLLAPGEETFIKVTFDTKTMSGPITKPITLVTNDPRRPQFQLMVRGTILPPYWLLPLEVNLGAVEKNCGAPPQEFSIIIAPESKVNVRFVQATSEFVTVQRISKAPELREDGTKEIRFKVALNPGHPVGLVRERITVTTDVPEKRAVSLGINAEVKGDVRIRPRTLRLGRVKRGQTPSRVVDVIKSGNPDLVIEKLIIKPEKAQAVFTVEQEVVEEGRHVRIKISVKPDAPARWQRGHVVIMTNCPGERIHQAYFYVTVKT